MKKIICILLIVLMSFSLLNLNTFSSDFGLPNRCPWCGVWPLEPQTADPPTCTLPGCFYYGCPNRRGCGYTVSVQVGPRGHSYRGERNEEKGIIIYTCIYCKDSYTKLISEHTCEEFSLLDELKPTCTIPGRKGGKRCKDCELIVEATIIPPKGHHHRENSDGVQPTCTEIGYTSSLKCPDCSSFVERKVIPALGHRPSVEKAIAPTCTETGLTEGESCSRCDEVFVAQDVIPATGHKTKTVGEKKATYFSKGWSGAEICQDCEDIVVARKATPKLKLKTPKATVKANKKKITVKYKKVKDAKGFEVKYKYNGKVVKKSYTTKKAKTIAFKNLKKGKYEFYIRAFTKQGNKKAYSNWTQVKKVKIV